MVSWPGQLHAAPATLRLVTRTRAPGRPARAAVMTLEELTARARSLVKGGHRAVLGITGSPGAGKTTFAEHLVRMLQPSSSAGGEASHWVAHVPMDGFHLADVELDRLGRRDRKGAPDSFDAAGY